jgi:HSP20 family molecular chaperone IbpA
MKNINVTFERIHPCRPLETKATDHSTAVRKLFDDLVRLLEQLKDRPQAKSSEGSLERWEDDQNIYLETDLASVFAPEIDVNVHDGRVYIRLER